MSAFAVFLICQDQNQVLVTTRDKGLAFGLPGGKVDPGESDRQACIREALEEGVDTSEISEKDLTFHYQQMVEGRLVRWYRTQKKLDFLDSYKEQHRGIRPLWIALDQFLSCQDKNDTYGNRAAFRW